MQHIPVIVHLSTNSLVNEKGISLTLILLTIDERLVLKAVILDIGSGNDMVYLV